MTSSRGLLSLFNDQPGVTAPFLNRERCVSFHNWCKFTPENTKFTLVDQFMIPSGIKWTMDDVNISCALLYMPHFIFAGLGLLKLN
jgi:hypothetical protein